MLRGVVIIALLAIVVYGQRIPENPCSNVFGYKIQRGIYHGEAAVPYDNSNYLNFAINVSMVGYYNNLKLQLTLLTPFESLSRSKILRYRIDFPFQNVIPKITLITFNNQVYCSGPPELLGLTGITNLWSALRHTINSFTYTVDSAEPGQIIFIEPSSVMVTNKPNNNVVTNVPTIQPQPPKEIVQRLPNQKESCGVANDVQTLVINGEKSVENEYPWLVAVFYRVGVSYMFQCTANLISDRHVVTAAHCIQFYKAPLIPKEDLLLVMGRSDLTQWAASGASIRTVTSTIVHPDYKQYTGHCDVAVMKLNKPVIFQQTIRPICLWIGDSDLDNVVNTNGVVAGWGKDEEGHETVPQPRKVTMPVVALETCLKSSGFRNLTSEMTFCAGKRNGQGPCTGDSGAGFIIKKNGKWLLRGLVSIAIKQPNSLNCNLNEYVIFSDAAKLGDWIKTSMK